MKNNNIENQQELPSMKKLIKSTILAVFLAAVILVTVVLPAEYGVDPTGIGSFIGLVKMGEIKSSLASEAAAEKIAQKTEAPTEIKTTTEEVVVDKDVAVNSKKIALTLSPNEGKEIKLAMKKGQLVNFVWYTNGGKANFDAHADSKPLAISYHNYEKGKMERNEGVMEAAFDGNHGWFWRNRTDKPMIVTLEVSGDFTEVFQY